MVRQPPDPDPIELAARSLRRHDRSRSEIDARLAKAGIGDDERADALETLERVGYLDDERVARTRAEALAARGFGDAGIRFDLEAQGIAAEVVATALAALTPESDRAAALVVRLGRTQKTAARLARKGFAAESLETALGDMVQSEDP
jgi:SOS response regulatory protein OraA/RecX